MDDFSAVDFALGFSTGIIITMVCTMRFFFLWLMTDPDGEGGWRSRLHQLGSEHIDKIGKRKEHL